MRAWPWGLKALGAICLGAIGLGGYKPQGLKANVAKVYV